MYHKISNDLSDGLTLPVGELEKQLKHISKRGYATISFLDLKESMETGKALVEKPIILTFDDAYENFLTHAFPLLSRYSMKATLFVPVAFMGKTNIWDKGNDPILTPDQIKKVQDDGLVEVGIHSFLHRSYAEMTTEDMKEDLENCFSTMEHHLIRTSRVLAYPYGGYPKKDPELKQQMKELFVAMQIWFAARIGNRINALPVKDRYEIKRIDIKGTDSFSTFKTKLKRGRKHPFA